MLAIWRVLLGLAARRMAGKLIAAAEAEAFFRKSRRVGFMRVSIGVKRYAAPRLHVSVATRSLVFPAALGSFFSLHLLAVAEHASRYYFTFFVNLNRLCLFLKFILLRASGLLYSKTYWILQRLIAETIDPTVYTLTTYQQLP